MPRKPKPYMVFETKEEFDKFFDKVKSEFGEPEEIKGFKNGCVWVLSYIEELLQDLFDPEAFDRAQREIASRQIERWRKNNDETSLKRKLDLANKFFGRTKSKSEDQA